MMKDTAATGASEQNRKLDSAGVKCWDAVLSELVRQLTPLGTERAALLDKIREHMVGILNWYCVVGDGSSMIPTGGVVGTCRARFECNRRGLLYI